MEPLKMKFEHTVSSETNVVSDIHYVAPGTFFITTTQRHL